MSDPRLQSYRSDPRRYDELLDGEGRVRNHWRTLIDGVFEDDARAARRATEFTRRMIVENGITYNVYADAQGRDRPWILDPLPYLMTAEEWQHIEAGVAQRAAVLNSVLADLYGPQELLAQGALPAEIPFGHSSFLWPCMGVRPPRDRWLSLYAVDLARSADGRWWVLADRTQGPSGPGYALENRQIVRRAFPHLAQSMDVRPLGTFFAALRAELLRDAGDEPVAVVLTPGSFNETYFEHAYIARQLGFPLVEGHDLTVRDARVYLKTLAGLKRVHTILRRLDDDFCDPVELRSDSALGVPGLLAAVRLGNVFVGNALGSGVLESAAWLGFLPVDRRAAARSAPDPALGRDLVVRRAARVRIRDRQSRESGHQADVPGPEPRRRLRQRLGRRRARRADRAHPRTALRLRGAGAPRVLAGAGLVHEERGPLFGACARHPGVCDRDAPRLPRHARRPRPLRLGCARGSRLHAARRRQQGHLGALRFRRGGRGIDRAHCADRPYGVSR